VVTRVGASNLDHEAGAAPEGAQALR
jgi:hypothetical protein